MLGLLFNEFLEFAEAQRSGRGRSLRAAVRRSAGGRYEPLRCYNHDELLLLAALLAQDEAVTRGDVLRRFGARLFARLTSLYPAVFGKYRSLFAFFDEIETVCEELRELHAAAELPQLSCRRCDDGRLEIAYASAHDLADLAEGLIRGCVAHFGGGVRLERHDVAGAGCRAARFVLTPSLQPPPSAAAAKAGAEAEGWR